MPEAERSRFEQLMGDNMEAFHVMVRGALEGWHGIYDVWLPDAQSYLIGAKKEEAFSPFCARLRQETEGEQRCLQCDLEAAQQAQRSKKPEVYLCHAGLLDVAVPIIVEQKLVACILCGQARALSPELDSGSYLEAQRLERELALPEGELTERFWRIAQVEVEDIHRIARRIEKTANFVSQVLDTQLALQTANEKLLGEQRERQEWTRRVTHQIIAPLNGVFGHAGALNDRFRGWRQTNSSRLVNWSADDVTKWQNTLQSLLETAHWAERLTRNLAYLAQPEHGHSSLIDDDFEIITDVPDFLIECARFFQGIARDRGIVRVHVEEQSVASMNFRLRIYPDYFRQAVQNLLDNAIKYGDFGSEITVDGHTTNGHGRICITNYGIRLRSEDCEKIFEYDFRTMEARERYPTGTGIGLSIAREMISTQEGTLTATPSEQTPQGWKTVFTIQLPLAKRKVLRF